jgi:pimeloyl-ACP methyl ester carboxylesterase
MGAETLVDVSAHLPAPGSRFELLDGVGHFLHLEQSERIAEVICGWVPSV